MREERGERERERERETSLGNNECMGAGRREGRAWRCTMFWSPSSQIWMDKEITDIKLAGHRFWIGSVVSGPTAHTLSSSLARARARALSLSLSLALSLSFSLSSSFSLALAIHIHVAKETYSFIQRDLLRELMRLEQQPTRFRV